MAVKRVDRQMSTVLRAPGVGCAALAAFPSSGTRLKLQVWRGGNGRWSSKENLQSNTARTQLKNTYGSVLFHASDPANWSTRTSSAPNLVEM